MEIVAAPGLQPEGAPHLGPVVRRPPRIGGDDGACVCAFDRRNGQPRWKALADVASYAAPIVIDQAGRRVVVCQTGDRIVGQWSPDRGSVSIRVNDRAAQEQGTARQSEQTAFTLSIHTHQDREECERHARERQAQKEQDRRTSLAIQAQVRRMRPRREGGSPPIGPPRFVT